MSSLFDAPVQLILVLAAAVSGQDPALPAPSAETTAVKAAARPDADGPYLFSAPQWLKAVRDGFGGEALDPFRNRIFVTSNGHTYVPVQSEARDILKLRQDEATAKTVARDQARFHAGELSRRLGRKPGVQDLYVAHLVGLETAVRLRELLASHRGARVADALPDLVSAHPEAAVWKGRSSTIAEFYARLPDGHEFAAEPQTIALIVSSIDIERTAPLRGIKIETGNNGASQQGAAGNSRMAGLDWSAEVTVTGAQ